MAEEQFIPDEELQKQYYELKSIDEHIKKLDKELTVVENKLSELDTIKGFVNDISVMSEKDALIPLTDGIFVKAKLSEQGEFIVNIGSNICVPKSTAETIALLDSQTTELTKYRDQIIAKMGALDEMARGIETEFSRELFLLPEKFRPKDHTFSLSWLPS